MESRSKSLSLLSCTALHGLNHAFQVVLPPLYLAIRNDLGLDLLSKVMLLGTAYLVTYAVVSVPFGIIGDRVSKKKFLTLGALFNSLAFVLAAFTGSYAVFLGAMILAGMGGGVYHPAASALIASTFRGMEGRAFGIIGMGAGAGLFVGPFASGIIGQQWGWRASCLIFAAAGLVVTAAFAAFMPSGEEKEVEPEGSGPGLRAVLITAVPFILVVGFRDFAMWGATYLTPVMTEMELGFSKQAAGSLIGFMNLTGIVAQPLMGGISDRVSRRRLIAGALLVAGAAIALFPHLGGTLIFVAALVAGFMVLGAIPPLDAAAAQTIPPAYRGRVFGLMVTLGFLMGGLSPTVTGIIVDASGDYRICYLMLGVSAWIAAALTFKIPRRIR